MKRPDVDLLQATDVSGGSGCEVWDCRALLNGVAQRYILKVYQPGFDDYAKLGPTKTARKTIHALKELPAFSICTPRMAGSAFKPNQAAVLTHKVLGGPWDSDTRIKAAKTLGRLHNVKPEDLSDAFGALVKGSTPNRQRVLIGVQNFSSLLDQKAPAWRAERQELYAQAQELLASQEPCSAMTTLVHGDYFSANLLLEKDDVYVIDWDLLALGDPTWDLSFLIGADRNLEQKEIDAVVEFGSAPFVELRESIWLSIFERAAGEKLPGLIFTFAFERTVRERFINDTLEAVESRGGQVLFVELQCDQRTLEKRLVNPSRRKFGKLTSVTLLNQLIRDGALDTPALPRPNFVVDTSKSSPSETARLVCEHFGLTVAP